MSDREKFTTSLSALL